MIDRNSLWKLDSHTWTWQEVSDLIESEEGTKPFPEDVDIFIGDHFEEVP